MKIGVNAAPLLRPFTGIGQYCKNLFKELAAIDSENEYVLVVYDTIPDELARELARIFPGNVRIEILPEAGFPHAGARKTWWEQVALPKFFKRLGVDIAFFPYPSNPWAAGWYRSGIKTVVTVHDCIPWSDDDYRSGFLSKMYHRRTRKAVGRADLILTVSEFSRGRIVELCRVDSAKVHVVYNDAAEIFRKEVDPRFSGEVLKKFGLRRGGYFLYCGGYDPRKNVEYLVEEYLAGNFSEPLVLVGGKLSKLPIYKSFDQAQGGGIIKTGFIQDAELAALYAGCLAFVHLSREEGFNIPLVEAAACGAPLILSDIPVHREIADGYAVFVDVAGGAECSASGGAESLADGGLSAPEAMRAMRERKFVDSRGLSEKFSWKKSAQRVKDMLSSI